MAKGEVHAQCAGPNVQALAASTPIPERYVRPETKLDSIAMTNQIELPVIDLAKLIDPAFSNEEAAKLHSACHQWSFFQLVNHGVPDELIEGLKENTIELQKKDAQTKEP